MNVAEELFDAVRASSSRSLVVVGTGKNVGKTVLARAVLGAAQRRGLCCALSSVGRDGESSDALDALDKPRFFLAAGTLVATARHALPEHPACEILDTLGVQSALGNLLLARVRRAGYAEIVGAPTASGLRAVLTRLRELGSDLTIVDGAIDRVASLAGGDDAVVIAVGATGAATMDEAVENARALAARLRIARYDPLQPFVRVEGALGAELAAELLASGETRQIVVTDPTRVALHGTALLRALERLRIRCERPLNVIAACVASIGRERYFEPRAFVEAVASATALRTFDVYAAAVA